MPIFWSRPDGSLAQTVIAESFLARERLPGETTAQAVSRLATEHVQRKDPSLADCTCVLVKSANVPADRSKRHAWRLDGTGTKIVVDATIPAPPHPKQALLDRVQAATNIEEMRAVLKEMIRG